jgi:hypothetical protein
MRGGACVNWMNNLAYCTAYWTFMLQPFRGQNYIKSSPMPAFGTPAIHNPGNIQPDTVPQRNFNPIYDADVYGPRPFFFSCDEFPFASTANGAIAARINCVPDSEQNVQFFATKDFYQGRSTLINPAVTGVPASWATNANLNNPWIRQFTAVTGWVMDLPMCTTYGDYFYVVLVNVPRDMYNFLANPDARMGEGVPDFCVGNGQLTNTPNPNGGFIAVSGLSKEAMCFPIG